MGVYFMISYDPLWKLLIDKKITKTELREKVGFSTNTLSKLSKNESVTLSILEKICLCLNCKIEDVVEIKKE
jgi:DNA-binding Xre family transcriptional regulator